MNLSKMKLSNYCNAFFKPLLKMLDISEKHFLFCKVQKQIKNDARK